MNVTANKISKWFPFPDWSEQISLTLGATVTREYHLHVTTYWIIYRTIHHIGLKYGYPTLLSRKQSHYRHWRRQLKNNGTERVFQAHTKICSDLRKILIGPHCTIKLYGPSWNVLHVYIRRPFPNRNLCRAVTHWAKDKALDFVVGYFLAFFACSSPNLVYK